MVSAMAIGRLKIVKRTTKFPSMEAHKEQHKKSIRFFNDREVRAVWDEEHSKWWFSVLDIIAAINEQDDYQKARNYSLKRCVDWSQIDKNEYLSAMRESVSDSTHIKALVQPALTTKIDDREMFMKGIDYSYYYEQNE